MKLPKIPLAQTVIRLCELKGIQHIVISPGSRNAPLTIGFSNHPFFKCYSIVDERSAAFFALGMAQKLQEPVAIVCTSGSALLNYYPAISEAYYSNIPLVVLSADRPKHLIGVGDGQTINQKGVFSNHILFEANLKEDINPELEETKETPSIIKSIENKLETFLGLQESIQQRNETLINEALNISKVKNGPVHINVPFNEPLYDMIDAYSVEVNNQEWNVEHIEEDYTEFINTWNNAKRKLVLVGVLQPNSVESKVIEKFANDDSVIVFTETTSNLYHEEFFPSIDKIIAPLDAEDFKQLQPEIVLTFGGLIVSKKVKAFLRSNQPKHHWHVGKDRANDTFFCLDKHFTIDVNTFYSSVLSNTNTVESNYKPFWSKVKAHRASKHQDYLNTIEYSDFKVFDEVLKTIPDNFNVHSSNSSAIRYTQLFDVNPTLKIYCNRGTSGIDGSTSTAVGFAALDNNPTLLITGDLSFFYDSNALWNNYIPNNFRIILVNNEGGGIFRILPGHKNTENFDTYFETKHQLTAEHLCKMYGFSYQKADSEETLNEALKSFYTEDNKPKLLEVFTPRKRNDEVLLTYFKYIK